MKQVPYTIYVTREFLQKRYPTTGLSINCSNVELEKLEDKDLTARLSKIDSLDSSMPLKVGTIAALNVPYKGQADVIKAVSRLKKLGIRIIYYLVGQGSPSRLIHLAKKMDVSESVLIIGPLKHSEIPKFLENIDIYIQPSKTEGLPRALIEAMSKACPTLGSNVGGIPELLDPSMLFHPGRCEEIVDRLVSLDKETLKDQAIRNFGEAGNFQKAILDNKRLEFYRQFLSEKFE